MKKNQHSILLPLKHQKDITSYLFFYYPLCVLLSATDWLPWFYENFVEIYMTGDFDLSYVGYDFNGLDLFPFAFDYNTIPYSVISDEKLREIICYYLEKENKYCYLYLDEYYMPWSENAGCNHFRHDILIFGFDDLTETFQALVKSDVRYIKVQIPFGQLQKAFTAGRNLDDSDEQTGLIVFRLKKTQKQYPFSIDRFTEKLIRYYQSETMDYASFSMSHVRDVEKTRQFVYYGMSCYDKLIKKIAKSSAIGFQEYQAVHFIYEHQHALLVRFQYIRDTYKIPELVPLCKTFKELVANSNQLRLTLIKQRLASHKYQTEGPVLAGKLAELIAQEQLCLRSIIRVLCHNRHTVSFFPPSIKDIPFSCKKIYTTDYPHGCYLNYQWEQGCTIDSLYIQERAEIHLKINGCEHTHFSTAESNQHICMLDTETVIKDLEIELFSYFPIIFDQSLLQIYPADLARHCRVEASSSWISTEGGFDENYTPDKAVDGNSRTHWNAKSDWMPGEFLSVYLPKPVEINCVVLQERIDRCRNREFAIEILLPNNTWQEIIRENRSWDFQKLIFHIDNVVTRSVRVVFYTSQEDEAGQSEPSLCHFQLYRFPNSGKKG